ncbi:LETM1-related biofilm-associated protein [Lishizhenia sp.]|uniref:LETM1-related biofilm-associated protein n=1 Tax=Lishizhenia sp. TaxID=2497594 RepID=UPI00299F5049|nr:LETM1-related biofilm-associated protein [Lishizhenia sp.]MDX1446630.1 LETM1-related biofilm-associated protein [Lishizhenia sp.]
MLSPGAKGWVKKYEQLLDEGMFTITEVKPVHISTDEHLRLESIRTGLAFGFPTQLLYANTLPQDQWTVEEKLKVLLFESLLSVYIMECKVYSKEDFLQKVLGFYKKHDSRSILNFYKKLIPESDYDKLEKILDKRIGIRKTMENKLWVNYLNNSVVYLDVLLFKKYLTSPENTLQVNYKQRVTTLLKTIIMAVNSDNNVAKREKMLFDVFLASANLKEEERKSMNKLFKEGELSFKDLDSCHQEDWIFKHYLLDVCSLCIFADNDAADEELKFLQDFCKHYRIPLDELPNSIALVETFLLENQHKIAFLKESSQYDKLFSNLSRRWIKILSRNKDKLAQELKQSKELVFLINKSMKEELTAEEKDKVRVQFLDIVKTMPALAIFMLPGGAILLPLVLKVIPDLVPSAFKNNALDDKTSKAKE